MQARAFNSITIDEKKGIFTKSSFNREKLRDEIHYYLNIPEIIADYFPKIIHYNDDYSAYQLEYFPHNTLSELILNNNISNENGREILNKLLDIMDNLHSIKPAIADYNKDICNFYISKTCERINDLKKNAFFKNLLSAPKVKINGLNYVNFPALEKDFSNLLKKFIQKDNRVAAIHGDFCFSNILYYPSKKTIKLIDPRGSFTNPGIYGHCLYDYAKLMHCLHSRYDFIVNENFALYEFGNESFYYEVFGSPFLAELEQVYINALLERGINIEFIYLIEASLFLSMASLHYENAQRQKIMYFIGLTLLNQVMEGKYASMY